MKAWFAASELAGLPGLPGTKRRVHARAAEDGWRNRAASSRGGTAKEYHIDNLPAAARSELRRREKIAAARRNAFKSENDNDTAPSLPAAERPLAEARMAVVAAFRSFHRRRGGPVSKVRAGFAEAFNAGAVDLDSVVLDLVPRLSAPTLARWDRAEKKHGLAGLARRYGNRRADGLIDRDAELRDFLIGTIVARPTLSNAMLVAAMRARFKDRELPAPRTVQRWVGQWKAANRRDLMAVADPDRWRSTYQAAAGSRSAGITRPNQLWELDSTIADVQLVCPETGRPRRFALVQAIDVATRRVMMLVARTSTAAAIAALLRRAVLEWGVPESVKTDEGADYTSRAIDTLLDALAIERVTCPPFTPEAKPHVERTFRTFQGGIVELLPGFVGHNVAERKAIESRRSFAARLGESDAAIKAMLTPDDFQDVCDRWAGDLYANRPHSGLGGKSPAEAVAEWPGEIRRIEDERALDLLLLPASGTDATRVVGKKGVKIDGGYYTHERLGAMIGEEVRVLTDPADLGHCYCFDLDGRFLCEAVNHIRRGISAREVAAKKRAVQREATARARDELAAAMRRVKVDDLAMDILKDAGEADGSVVRFERHSAHSTPDLVQAGLAARESDFTARDDGAEEARLKTRLGERGSRPELSAVSTVAEKQSKFQRARSIGRALDDGQKVSEDDRNWFSLYSQSAEYRAQLRMSESEVRIDTG